MSRSRTLLHAKQHLYPLDREIQHTRLKTHLVTGVTNKAHWPLVEACAVAHANPEGCARSGKRVRGVSKGVDKGGTQISAPDACAVAPANPERCALSGKRVRGMSKGGEQRWDSNKRPDACAVAPANPERCARSGKRGRGMSKGEGQRLASKKRPWTV